MALPHGAKRHWWRARRRLYALHPPYAYRIAPSRDRFELHFSTSVIAVRHLATRSGRQSFLLGLDSHRQHCLRTGGYSPEYFTGLDRWRRRAGGRTW